MAKVSNAHAVKINIIMCKAIGKYTKYCNDTDFEMLKMYTDDLAHNIAALNMFNTNLNAEALHNNIMRQDTAPRDAFYNVLVYIEKNELISANKFACL